MDEFHGQGGTFEVDPASGVRRRLIEPVKMHEDGDRPRDERGKPTDAVQEKSERALPEPAAAPWAPPAPAEAAPRRARKGE